MQVEVWKQIEEEIVVRMGVITLLNMVQHNETICISYILKLYCASIITQIAKHIFAIGVSEGEIWIP